jgi:hypothetical protein
MLRAFARKKPVDLIIASSSFGFAAAKSLVVLYFLKSAGVTIFTRLSVHCADKTVATKS